MVNHTRTAAAGAALVVVAGALASPAWSADAATTASHPACQSKQSFFRAIPAKTRKHLRHHDNPQRAIEGLRCTSHWSVASVETAGRGGYQFLILEHRTSSGWQVGNRAYACKHHRVPKKLHHEVCDTD